MSGALESIRARLGSFGVAPAEALALLVLLTGVVALTVAVWLGTRPGPPQHAVRLEGGAESTAVPSSRPSGAANAATPPAPTPTAGDSQTPSGPVSVVVHVSGQVVAPGLVVLTDGDRVQDAILAAGGPSADADMSALNLARLVGDGEQIYLPGVGEEVGQPEATVNGPAPAADPADGGESAGGPSAGQPVDLNQADATVLETLPGVGPVMAARIIAHREVIGQFADVTQLLEVPGIGPARLAELQPLVRTGP